MHTIEMHYAASEKNDLHISHIRIEEGKCVFIYVYMNSLQDHHHFWHQLQIQEILRPLLPFITNWKDSQNSQLFFLQWKDTD